MEIMPKDFVYQRFVGVIGEVFSTMVGITVAGLPIPKDKSTEQYHEICGMMFLTGKPNAMISLSMTYQSAALIISYMTGSYVEELSKSDVCDGVAELVNIIAGKGKASLHDTPYYYQLTSPFTISGQELVGNYKNKAVQWRAGFSSSEVAMCFEFIYL